MRDPKRRAKSMAVLWLRKCYDLGITAGEVVTESAVTTSAVTTVTTQEKGREKETFPPAPPIERKGREEKSTTTPHPARACVRERPAVVDISRPPTLNELLAFAHSRGCTDDAFCRKWFDKMENELFWRHPKTGHFLNHWVAYFLCCYRLRNIESAAAIAVKPGRGVSQTANVHSKEVGRW